MNDQVLEQPYKNYILDKLLKDKDALGKGVIIETGAGNPLYNILCTQPNTASKLVKYASSPTDFKYTKEKYQLDDGIRAVSYEAVKCMVEVEEKLNPQDIEWIFANSIQIGNTPDVQTHGWIGLYNQSGTTYYHFTINNYLKYNRVELLDIIQLICLDVLLSDNGPINNGYIDQVIHNNTKVQEFLLIRNLQEGKLIKENCDDTYACYYNNKFNRFNDFLRTLDKTKELVIFKGSFNPLHEMHYDMYKAIADQPDKECVLMISINNREINKVVTHENLLQRIHLLSELGIKVIINTRGYFEDCIYFFKDHQERQNNKAITFLVGDDTMKRIIDDNTTRKYHWEQVKFIIATRNQKQIKNANYDMEYINLKANEVSSTEIRKALTGEYDVNLLYTNKTLLELVTKYFKNEQ